MAKRGVSVGLIAPDAPFVNNYGVWLNEFEDLGLKHCLLHEYDEALVWFNDSDPAGGISLGRGYGQVCRRRLREELLGRCKDAGVKYLPGLVDTLTHGDGASGEPSVVTGTLLAGAGDHGGGEGDEGEDGATSASSKHKAFVCKAKVVVCGTGHNRDMLRYERGQPPGWQTAYGIEVKMPGHPFPPNKAVFMDFRQSDPEVSDTDADGMWRVPSFLYVLPVDEDTVFVEETCLVARVQVPFDELKRRLYRRLSRMGLGVEKENIIEEEASWIPLGGTPPVAPQRTLAYGAAAGLVHPASGYSIVNSLRTAPAFADAVVNGLKTGGAVAAAEAGWDTLWGDEPRRQIGFYQFGMELLMSLRIEQMRNFFKTFFGLPTRLSAGFLSNDLSSVQLLQFAFMCFVQGNNALRALLLTHLVSAGAGVRLGQAYAYPLLKAAGVASVGEEEGGGGGGGGASVAGAIINRKAPPQDPNFVSYAKDLVAAEKKGMMPGFQAKEWWLVGSGDSERASGDDDEDGGGYGGGGAGRTTELQTAAVAAAAAGSSSSSSSSSAAAASMVADEGSTAYWSNGSAALVVSSAVRNTGVGAADLYGTTRRKFLPDSLLASLGPSTVVPAYLTGELPGDVGWDPLQMGAQRDLTKLRERELIHGRWAMLAAVGVLTPELTAKLGVFGAPGSHWWNTAINFPTEGGLAGAELTYLGETIPFGLFWLPIIHLPVFFVAEMLRTGKYEVERFRGLDRMYPGGSLFDPLGIGRDIDETELKVLKTIEINHCRLAMTASFGFIVEAALWGAGPLDWLP